ncbi:unnamed protein product [Ceutorhynchus assimilis]|uniref:Galectin n=1 Tax=Ceutorhynchus assimilis TaxID=467358 RepID=A0A9P0DKW6_9CUCU|nr:unnamed protein product [Ceutorhynchus assimilis]
MEVASDALDFDFCFVDSQVAKLAEPDAIYGRELQEPLVPGSCVVIRGTIRPQCKRFAINLIHVKTPYKSDIVFHFNPRLALRYIVRNSRIGNSWGDEEITSIEKFHLDRKKAFDLQIVATQTEFLVAVDGRHVCAYVYRVPLERVNRIEVEAIDVEGIEIFKQIKTYPSVEGAIDVAGIDQKHVDLYPESSIENIPFIVTDLETPADQKLVVPITAELPKGFQEGWQLEIIGRVKILPSSFYINLQQGKTLWPHPLIPLHLNPRFYTSYGNHLFVRNAWMNGEWGHEECTPGFQFTPGQKFHLAIRMNPDTFGVWVDGILAGEFQFRTPTHTIDTVYIHGDVQIRSICLKDHIDDKYFSKGRERINVKL